MKYELKSVKTLRSTGAFEANLYMDGKRIGWVENSGHGAGSQVRFSGVDRATADQMLTDLYLWVTTVNATHWTAKYNSTDTAAWQMEENSADFLYEIAMLDKDARKGVPLRVPFVATDEDEWGVDQEAIWSAVPTSTDHLLRIAATVIDKMGDTVEMYDPAAHAWVKATDVIANGGW